MEDISRRGKDMINIREYRADGRPAGSLIIQSDDGSISDDDILTLLITPHGFVWTNDPDKYDEEFVGSLNGTRHGTVTIIISKESGDRRDFVEFLDGIRASPGMEKCSFIDALTAAVWVADLALKVDRHRRPDACRKRGDTWLFARYCHLIGPSGPLTFLIEPNVHDLAKAILHKLELTGKLELSCLSMYDIRCRATVLMKLGQLLSESKDRKAVLQVGTQRLMKEKLFGNMLLWELDHLFICSMRLNVDTDEGEDALCVVEVSDRRWLIPVGDPNKALESHHLWQLLSLDAWKIPPQAVEYLCSRVNNMSAPLSDRVVSVVDGFDILLAEQTAYKITLEAEEKGAYVPVGAFSIRVPEGTPLSGLKEIAFWTDGWCFWCHITPGGQVFRWLPSMRDNNIKDSLIGLPRDIAAALHLIISAIWLDLVVAGPAQFPEGQRITGDCPRRLLDFSDRPDLSDIEPLARSERAPMGLPRRPHTPYYGDYRWTTPDEERRIRLRAHYVAGHIRRLPDGTHRSQRAEENAQQYPYIVLPEGYTFVAPYHTKDSESGNHPDETPIVARGLATLIALGKLKRS
jgi:hypothetical protein